MMIKYLGMKKIGFQKFHRAPNRNGNKDNQKPEESSNTTKRNKLIKVLNLKKESASMKNHIKK